jgi:Zn-dependent protease with chaperone function
MNTSTLGGGRITGTALLLLTHVLDYPILFVRAVVAMMMVAPVAGEHAIWVAGGFAYLPVVRSLVGLVIPPLTPAATPQRLGAREPSTREWERIEPALEVCIRDGVKAPARVFVVDTAEMVAFVVGRSLFVQRDAIWSPHLSGWIAHEIGHLNGLDLRLKQALRWSTLPSFNAAGDAVIGQRRVVFWPLALARVLIGVHLKAMAGGFFPRLLDPLWSFYWRRREFVADAFAAKVGQGETLAAGLEETLAFDSASPWMKDRSHPYVELRIDRLRKQIGASPEPAHAGSSK